MEREEVIEKTTSYVKETLADNEAGHNWWHIYRVWKLALHIAQEENASEKINMDVVELGALLHDIADSKFHNGDEEVGPKKAEDFLSGLDVDKEVIVHVQEIIRNISFKGGHFKQKFKSPELDIVQDADRLDGIGAIGISRTFHYGGHMNREIHNPHTKTKLNMTPEEYSQESIRGESTSINHFYEKLLLLKNLMNTPTGKKMAEHRHQFMETYLEEFYAEWEGKK